MKNKLLWLLAGVIAFDFGITMLGQPAGYWHHPDTAHEGNPVFRWFMVRGAVCYLAFVVGYIGAVVALVSRLPRQAAIITGSVFLLVHYFAGLSWVAFHFHHDMIGLAIYALVLSIALKSILNPADWKACFGNHSREQK
jgi:hypothetical protein